MASHSCENEVHASFFIGKLPDNIEQNLVIKQMILQFSFTCYSQILLRHYAKFQTGMFSKGTSP